MGFGYGIESGAQVGYACVYVETVDGIDTFGKEDAGVAFDFAGRGTQYGYFDVVELEGIGYYVIPLKFFGLGCVGIAAYDTCDLKVGGLLKCFKHVAADVAISDNGGSDFFHTYTCSLKKRTACHMH